MGVFAYPHREGAKLTLDIILGKLDGEEDPGFNEYILVVKDRNFIMNMRTVYRETKTNSPVWTPRRPEVRTWWFWPTLSRPALQVERPDRAVLIGTNSRTLLSPWNVFQLRCLVLC